MWRDILYTVLYGYLEPTPGEPFHGYAAEAVRRFSLRQLLKIEKGLLSR